MLMPFFSTAALRTHHDGTVEFVKWIALAAMLVDHVGLLVFGQGKFSLSDDVGRIAFPLFAFVLGFKLAAGSGSVSPTSLRTVKRLFLWALISFVPFYLATGRLWPPDIFFTLGLGALACWVESSALPDRQRWLAYLGIFIASFGCDYFAPGVFLILSVCVLYRRSSASAAAATLLCCALLALMSWNPWTLLALPIASSIHWLRLSVPRLKWLFYAIYPLHLLAIAVLVAFRPFK